jgi:hypothetical protein
MMGEELNAAEMTEHGLLGDRLFAVVDPATGKVAGAKHPSKWGNFFDFRATYVEPPKAGSKMPAVRVTLPDGAVVTSDQPDLAQVLSRALGRDVVFAEARHDEESTGCASCTPKDASRSAGFGRTSSFRPSPTRGASWRTTGLTARSRSGMRCACASPVPARAAS